MKILVTGSSGVIGKYLIRSLKNEGFEPVEFHRNTQNPHHFGDVTDLTTLNDKVMGCQGIIHLAAISRVKCAEQNPDLCYEVNVKGTENVLEAANTCLNKPWVLFVSSQEVYGLQHNFPVKESAEINPKSIYAKTKAEGEKITEHYKKFGLKTSIVRLSSVYGCVDDHPDKAIPAFCAAAAEGKALNVNASNNIYDFTHISDVTRGLIAIVKKLSHEDNHPTLHLVSGTGTTLGRAANIAISFGKRNSKIMDSTHLDNYTCKFYGDPALAKRFLNWQTEISIEDGINNLVKNFIERSRK